MKRTLRKAYINFLNTLGIYHVSQTRFHLDNIQALLVMQQRAIMDNAVDTIRRELKSGE